MKDEMTPERALLISLGTCAEELRQAKAEIARLRPLAEKAQRLRDYQREWVRRKRDESA